MNKSKKHPEPPRWATYLLHLFCADHLVEEIEGDLEELFFQRIQLLGEKKARIRYVLDVMSLMRSFVFKNKSSDYIQPLPDSSMIRNYLTIALRNLLRQKLNSSLNIIGLAAGITCSLFILLYVRDELHYDKQFIGSDRIYRITLENIGEKTRHWAATAPLIGESMAQEIPGITEVARFHRPYPDRIFSYTSTNGTSERFEEKSGFYADPAVVHMFNMELVKGDLTTALKEVNTIILTTAMAKKYFGDQDPIGKVIQDDMDNIPMKVTGVVKEFPFPTHLQFDYLISMSTRYQTLSKEDLHNPGWSSFYNYVLLDPSQSKTTIEAKFPEFMKKFYAPTGETPQQIFSTRKLHLQPIQDIHLHSKLEKEIAPNSDSMYVYIFSVAAALILLLAAVNFINISTAQAFKRMKEVGVRKAMGASKSQLIRQFVGEAFLLAFIATSLALFLFRLIIPLYNTLSIRPIEVDQLFTLQNIGFVLVLVVLVGWLAGSYPAWFIAGFNSIESLKGKKTPRSSIRWVRQGMIVFQFAVSVFMIFSTLIIYQQLRFFHSKDIGFDKQQVIAVKVYGKMYNKIETIMQTLRTNPAVSDFSMTSTLPGDRFSTDMFIPVNDPQKEFQLRHIWVNSNFLSTLGIELKEGNGFDHLQLHQTAYILNEAAIKAMNLDSPLGMQFVSRGDTGKIMGIVKDFHFASLHSTIEPLVIVHKPFQTNYMLINVAGNHLPETLELLKSTFHSLSPETLFSYTFLNEKLNMLYASENRMSQVFQLFSGLTILISCLGLFSLVIYTVELRTKEIGIRKILGSSVLEVIMLLLKNFLQPVLIATLIAWPFAWWVATQWLQNFAYHIAIDWKVFAGSALLIWLIAILTVSFQSIRAALTNPVNTLRNE
ncbi:FtsX-like permease family protein [Xanthocytophaga agilis]|uniref:Permease prefix domain 2-containing transporter n=1 Tax=Xanthocytophaga agilis TaxID=3048010 RepID=A0AAE3R0D0_9BACT|nr:FtsX-like permease family protein [Xanthocytophaga agilis]MDJ1500810.1 permease prefix domain 2-containing transporter [Xanthocytophaga agilis]